MPPRTFQADTPLQALLVEQALALARVEALAVPAGRELTRRAVEAALQQQAAAAETRGRPGGPARGAAGPPTTRGGPAAPS